MELQIPQFIYSTPTIADGGGAEVVVPSTWFDNNNQYISSLYEVEDQFPVTAEGGTPFDFNSTEISFTVPSSTIKPDLSLFITPTATLYSASGFDLLSILSRVATRPNPRIVLGPVDLTCSFVIVDIRRYDHPIVYCSPSFCTLTGYSEPEVIGKNCRFLQAPGGQVSKGDIRRFTSHDAVVHLAKSLMADKECQTSIVNYKKNGDPFINLVTVIPIHGGVAGHVDEQRDVVFQVGFQVDLSEQPNAILEKLRDGSYVVDYAHHQSRPVVSRQRKPNSIPPVFVSKELKRLLVDPTFLRSLPITSSTTLQSSSSISSVEESSITQLLHLLLLEASPDFIHVVSLKGTFLYVAPSVRRVLGYEPDEMVGTCIADYAHPEDVVPLMRELKESSATGLTSAQLDPGSDSTPYSSASLGSPRSVDLLFRAKTKMGRHVWVECRGRLHVEPGKGRKAIILSGRAREMMNLKWEDVDLAGGLATAVKIASKVGNEGCYRDQEFWGMLGGTDKDSARFLSVGKGAKDVLGWTSEELLGKGLSGIVEEPRQDVLGEAVRDLRRSQRSYYARGGTPDNLVDPRVRKVRCRLATKSGSGVDVWFILYRADPDLRGQMGCVHETGGNGVSPAPLVYQIRRVDAQVVKCRPGMMDLSLSTTFSSDHQDVFHELDISRGSSWQYELQQLRFANIRLKEELKMLEAAEEVAVESESFEGYSETGSYQEQPPSIRQQQQQYSLPMPPPPLPVLAPQPQIQMQTPDHLLDQRQQRQYHFQLLDDQISPARSSVKRLMTESTRIGPGMRLQQQQALQYNRTDWHTIPSPSLFPSLHCHQHQHIHHHHSLGQGQDQRRRLKRSWNTMESA